MSKPTRAELEEFFVKRLLAALIRDANQPVAGTGDFVNCDKCSKVGLVHGEICPDCNGYGLSVPYGNGEPTGKEAKPSQPQ